MCRYLGVLAAFLVQTHPPALAPGLVVLDPHGHDRAGFDDVRVYYLSFGDSARDESRPVVRD